jgi:2,3-bisphosphoglycerate-dependent phosphoglycerate mutase
MSLKIRIAGFVFVITILPLLNALASAASCSNPPERLYILRHAEKQDSSRNSPLSPKGWSMAGGLVVVLAKESINAIYTTQLARTIQTATPLAKYQQLNINEMEKKDIRGLIRKICTDHSGEVVVVVGHSDTIPPILERIGLKRRKTDYGDLYEIAFSNKEAVLTKRRYGACDN